MARHYRAKTTGCGEGRGAWDRDAKQRTAPVARRRDGEIAPYRHAAREVRRGRGASPPRAMAADHRAARGREPPRAMRVGNCINKL